MKKIVKTESKNTRVQIEAPIALTPEQIAQIAAGTCVRGGNTAVSGHIPVNPVKF